MLIVRQDKPRIATQVLGIVILLSSHLSSVIVFLKTSLYFKRSMCKIILKKTLHTSMLVVNLFKEVILNGLSHE